MYRIKQCLECGDYLIGRRDKKFCTDNCRSTYNNKLYQESNYLIRSINKSLRKNRRILSKLEQEGKMKVDRYLLLSMGFSFEFTTRVCCDEMGRLIKYCYEFGYVEHGDEINLKQLEHLESNHDH